MLMNTGLTHTTVHCRFHERLADVKRNLLTKCIGRS
jgi:hypothetical protein